ACPVTLARHAQLYVECAIYIFSSSQLKSPQDIPGVTRDAEIKEN
ncbi:MAG: hypothetical protein K940chlam7_00798, partial [Chlamydiae bacterium]|nr:hypothetical protein [Chlamydiota bacterium]